MSKAFSELEQKIKENAQKYYTDGSQDLTDEEFDTLVDTLQESNPHSSVLTTGWGYEPQYQLGQKCKHKYGFAGSLDKCHDYQEFPPRYKDTTCIATPKLDGMSIILYYEFGHLVQALTRGDGTIGIDVTDKVRKI